MDLPKISNQNLPKELKEILGDGDAHFDAIVDPSDIIDLPLDTDSYYEGQNKIHQMLIESRRKQDEYIQKQ